MIALLLLSSLPEMGGAQNAGLVRYDMARLPLSDLDLESGSFSQEPVEFEKPFRSIVFLHCEVCSGWEGAQVALYEDVSNLETSLASDFAAFRDSLKADCTAKNGQCEVVRVSNGGLEGFEIEARYPADFHLLEQTYFFNGLRVFISSHGTSDQKNRSTIETLKTFAWPYVTGTLK